MEKALFSITCTTCQARLVVRSEAAIGTILECPRCQSMVQVAPPHGWQPAPPSGQLPPPTEAHGPPPLDRVAEVPLTLEPESAEMSLLGRVFHNPWLLWGAGLLAVLTAVIALLWMVLYPRPEQMAVESPSSPPAVAKVGADQPPQSAGLQSVGANRDEPATVPPMATKTEAPAPPVVATSADKPPASPEPQSKDVKPEPTLKTLVPTPSTPSASSSAPSQSLADAKPTAADPSPPAIEKAANGAAGNGGKIEINKEPPPQVDVAARLADPIAQLELTGVPLCKAVDLLAAMGTLPVTVDCSALTQLGVTSRDLISVQLSATTVGDALRAVVKQRGLTLATDGGQVIVTTPAEYRETLVNRRYTVSDLTGDNEAATAELAALVRKLVAPESWQQSGGRGTIAPERGALAVVQTGDVHQQVLVFCEKLRNARDKPLRSRDDPKRFTLDTRLVQAREMLDRPVTANFHEPAALAKILALLSEASGGDILVDRAALAAAETSDRVEASVTAEKRPLGAVLTELLRPLGLSYRAIVARTIQVTTKEAAEERLELEFYPVGAWLTKGTPGPALAERLKAQVAASTWSDAGGPGEVYFDPPSQYLIVLQSQPAQAAVERLLGTKGEGGGRKGE